MNTEHLGQKGQLVGVFEESMVIQLHGRFDETQFWSQPEALRLLKDQLVTSIAGQTPHRVAEQPMPLRPAEKSSRPSFFGRRTSQAPVAKPVAESNQPPVQVDVGLDEANFRSLNDYGLYETLRGPALKVVVDIR